MKLLLTAALALVFTIGAAPEAAAQPTLSLGLAGRTALGSLRHPDDLILDELTPTQPTPRPDKVALAGGAQLAVQYVALLLMQPPNWQDHGNSLTPTWAKFSSNFTVAPVWSPRELGGGGSLGYLQADGDAWGTNVIGHGLQGSEIYLRMRQEHYGPGAAFIGGVIHSTFWEYMVEGWNETPSAWDLTYTPIGGALLGELRHIAAKGLRPYEGTPVGFALLAVIDPVGVVF